MVMIFHIKHSFIDFNVLKDLHSTMNSLKNKSIEEIAFTGTKNSEMLNAVHDYITFSRWRHA